MIASQAYEKSAGGKEAPMTVGLTGDQGFFLGCAKFWEGKSSEDKLRRRLPIGHHFPSAYRTTGIVSHMPEFYAVSEVKPDDPLYRPHSIRVRVWYGKTGQSDPVQKSASGRTSLFFWGRGLDRCGVECPRSSRLLS